MAETEFSVKTVGIDYKCDQCDAGFMRPHGSINVMINPPVFPHKCSNDNCNYTANLSERYPTMRVLRVTEDGNG